MRPGSSMMLERNSPASALLLATLVAALLASAAALMLSEARSARAASSEGLRSARAELAADKLLAIALVRLDAGDPVPAQGLLFEDSSGGRVLRQDAAGLVDINAAPPDRLAALLVSFGADPDEAAALGDAIADWRDADNLRHLHGAEAEEYARAGRPPPANRPFMTETELASVLGMRADLLACAAPYLTVYSGAPDVDADAAPPDLRQRLGLAGAGTIAQAQLGRLVILRAEAPISAAAVLQKTLRVRLTGDPSHPLMVQRASESLAPAGEAPANPQCVEPRA